MGLLTHFIIVVLGGYGMAVALVEKKRQWPVRPWHLRIKRLLRKIDRRLGDMLSCTVCTSFWTTLLAEVLLLPLTQQFYWLWPVSGFVALALTWTVIQFLDAIDPK